MFRALVRASPSPEENHREIFDLPAETSPDAIRLMMRDDARELLVLGA